MERKVGEKESAKVLNVKPAAATLVSRNEKVEYEARKSFYASIAYEERKLKKIEKLQFIGKVVIPIFIISFSSIYFWYGLSSMTQ